MQRISIPADVDGFFSLECPHCGERFKAFGKDIDANETIELFCPFCGIPTEPNCFIPKSVKEHGTTLVENELKTMINKTFKDLRRSTNRNKFLKVNLGRKLQHDVPNLLTEDDDLELIQLDCCNKELKVPTISKNSFIYCAYCGVEQ